MKRCRFIAAIILSFLCSSRFNAQESSDLASLTSDEVDRIVRAAVQSISSDDFSVVVVDRAGRILAVWQKPNATLETAERALSLARTGAFFSNDQAPLSSRTVRYISGVHYPPGVPFQFTAALYGIENTNRGCSFNTEFNPGSFVPRATSLAALLREEGLDAGPPLRCDGLDNSGCSAGVTTGKFSGNFVDGRLVNLAADELRDERPLQIHGGGVPIFKDCRVIGGVGVFGIPANHAEYAAFVGSVSGGPGFGPLACLPPPFAIYLEGLRLPFVEQTSLPADAVPGELNGDYLVPPREGGAAAEGWLIGGPDHPRESAELSASDVQNITQQAVDEANRTRAAIRLPIGSRARMVIAVSDLDGNVLGLYRMPDATVFSIDVAVAKSRNASYFSSDRLHPSDLPGIPPGTAVSNRTIGFTSQPMYPPGIDGTAVGASWDLYLRDIARPCTQGFDTQNPLNTNGVIFFPGSLPLYRGGRLIGGLGVSGDGVEQDDLVSAAAARSFAAPSAIQATRVILGGIRLPYLKFPRNPYQ